MSYYFYKVFFKLIVALEALYLIIIILWISSRVRTAIFDHLYQCSLDSVFIMYRYVWILN